MTPHELAERLRSLANDTEDWGYISLRGGGIAGICRGEDGWASSLCQAADLLMTAREEWSSQMLTPTTPSFSGGALSRPEHRWKPEHRWVIETPWEPVEEVQDAGA